MKPIIFGSGTRQLYGVFHPAQAGKRRQTAVLLCYPHVSEYNFVHRAFRQIALALAAEGFDAFRFDYSGTGDSSGEVSEFGIDDWVADINVAAAELQDLARVRDIAIVGRQLGSLLAARAARRGLAVRRMVMWEPAFEGAEFLKSLEVAHRSGCLGRLQPYSAGEWPWTELLGFPFPLSLRDEVSTLRLSDEIPEAVPVSVLVSSATARKEAYRRYCNWCRQKAPEGDSAPRTSRALRRVVEMAGVPHFEPGTVLEGIVPAGPVPGYITEQLIQQWDSE